MNDIIELEEKIKRDAEQYVREFFFGEYLKNTSEVVKRTVNTEYNDGTSIQETYTRGVWYSNIRYQNGIVDTHLRVFPNADKGALAKMLASLTQQDIANTLGITQPTVSRKLNKD